MSKKFDVTVDRWEMIKEFEGLYDISIQGNIKSLIKHHHQREQVLKPKIDKYGYECVILYKKGKPKYKTIHRLVAETFIPNPENKPQVNHIDGNKKNNHVDNLEWVTHSENTKHSYNLGLQIGKCNIKKRIKCIELDIEKESIKSMQLFLFENNYTKSKRTSRLCDVLKNGNGTYLKMNFRYCLVGGENTNE